METLKAELETCRAERDALKEQIATNTARHETDVAFIRFQAESEMTSLTETHEQQLARLEGQLKSAHERLTATRNLLESQDQAVGALRLQKTGLEDQLKQIQATAEAETGKEVLRLRVGMNVEMDAARARAREREAELMSRLETAAKDAETSKAALSVTQGDVDKMRQEAIRRGEQLAESRKECDELRQKLQEKSIAPPPASSTTSRPRSRSRPRTSISSGSQVEDLAPLATTGDDDDDDIIILDEDPGITSSRRAPQPPPKSQPKPSTPSQRSKRSRPADEDMEMLKKVAKEIVARSFTEDYMCKFCL
jgi:chromosome segregation ATPase